MINKLEIMQLYMLYEILVNKMKIDRQLWGEFAIKYSCRMAIVDLAA